MNLTSFALRRGALITLILAFASVLAACSGGNDASQPPANGGAGGDTATVEGGNVEISAADLVFNVTTIEAPAGEDFTITLVNDDSAPHNVSVYSEEGGELLAEGPFIDPDQTGTTDVSALEPGTYYFVCDLHPEMNGSLVVQG
jgi:plastocyanin